MARKSSPNASEVSEVSTSSNSYNETEAESGVNYNPQAPEGYESVPDDLLGFWDNEIQKTIHVTMLEAKIFDSNLDKSKVATLITCRLESPALLRSKDEHGNEVEVKGIKGDIIGIWGKPGMRKKVFNRAGVDLYITQDGEKDTGKGFPMKTFDIKSDPRKTGKKLPLAEDTRDKSRRADTWWTNELDDNGVAPF